MNLVILSGRLVRDPEIRYTKQNTAVARFVIATNEGKDKDGNEITEFIRCTAFKKTAEFIDRFFLKGSAIIVTGRWHTNTWEKDGEKHYDTEVQVRTADFQLGKPVNVRDIDQPGSDFSDVDDDVELPF